MKMLVAGSVEEVMSPSTRLRVCAWHHADMDVVLSKLFELAHLYTVLI